MKFKKSNKSTGMLLNQTGDGHYQNSIYEPVFQLFYSNSKGEDCVSTLYKSELFYHNTE